MIKKAILFVLCLVASSNIYSQTEDELKALALAQAQITSDATVAQDYSTVLDYTLPAVLDLMGGKAAALATVKSTMASMEEQGLKVLSSEVIKMVGFAYEQEQYRCVIENKIMIQMDPTTRVQSISYIIGLYDQDISQWHFIEAGEFKNKMLMDMVLPGFETQLVVPDDVKTFVED